MHSLLSQQTNGKRACSTLKLREFKYNMFSSSASVFAVSHQARAICAQHGSKERHRFLVGTCSLHEHNELAVLEYHEDSNAIDSPMVYSHPEQIWYLDASHSDPTLAVTSWQNNNGDLGVTVWKLPHQTADDIENAEPGQYLGDRLTMDSLGNLTDGSSQNIANAVKWHPSKESILVSNKSSLYVWSITDASVKKQVTVEVPLEHCQQRYISSSFSAGAIAWDPHSANACCAGFGDSLFLADTRTSSTTVVERAHAGIVRDIDYNPNKPLTFVSAGDDRTVKFWDARNLKAPIKTLYGHSHWAWTVRYNPFHDQLLMSGSTDQSVTLWRIASCSSAPWLGSEGFDEADDHAMQSTDLNADPPDVKVRHMDQHEESVYGVAWSPADAWVYCSMSYDGRIILNHVPSTEKYKILL